MSDPSVLGPPVLGLEEIEKAQTALVGGKGAHLGELSRVDGVRVPAGFCLTTEAFRRVVTALPSLEDRLDRLCRVDPDDAEAIRTQSAPVRASLEAATIPDDVSEAITRSLARLGERSAYAVRSSATAEDLPAASFAGLADTYLNVVGSAAVLRRIGGVWASLFSERAVIYRLRHGIDHRKVRMAVVVQQMVFPQAAGICFTADPITSNRKVACVEASFGLGEALVAGLVNPDVYRVREGEIVAKAVATKTLTVEALPAGGTQVRTLEAERRDRPALTDAQVVRLVQLGRLIEAHFGRPQDIEWCLVDDEFQIVQSRPITTLFPIPPAGDQENHVYVSVGHQQMMTDPMKPLGLSIWQLTTPRSMAEAGGRLFVDVVKELASSTSRARILEALGRSDPLIGDALRTVLERPGFVPTLTDDGPAAAPASRTPTSPAPASPAPPLIEADPAVVADLVERGQASLARVERDIRAESGPALLELIRADIGELQRVMFDPASQQVIRAAMEAAWWLDEHLQTWLGEKNAAGTLAQSVPHNVTSEMGLALLDVADVIRPHPEVVAFLEQVRDETFLDGLLALEGGREARDAIEAYLHTYGMRCVGEIDITKPRWSEHPATLVPMILGNVRNFERGAGERRFAKGRRQAREKERSVLDRLAALPDGERKTAETKSMIDRVRTFAGYREYPKYHMISRYYVHKRALLAEADRLVDAGALREREDLFYLRFDELHDLVRTNHVDDGLIRRRKEAFGSYHSLRPPRVLTSDGEVINGAYGRDDVPAGALVGLAVSAGTVEGRARVIGDMAEADLKPGDILVTAYTDPSWTPVFVAIKALVTEVGGSMTHGAVIAREYGLPAVVGVEHATRLIGDGQRIRVHGTEGYVEIL